MWMRGRERKGGEKPNPGKYLPYEICGEFIFVDNRRDKASVTVVLSPWALRHIRGVQQYHRATMNAGGVT